MMESYLNFYGKEYFLKSWMSLYDTLNTIYNEQEGDLCRSLLCRIQCPTLIVHGSLDPMIAPEHPHHLKEHIRNSR
jgi:valacyclovir hydrolase